MKGVRRILVTSAGRRVELLGCFRQAAGELGVRLEVLACDMDPLLSAACQSADASFAVPRCDDPSYVGAVLDIVRTNAVDLVIPTIDPELLPFAQSRTAFAELGARINVSSPETVMIAQDKAKTALVLADAGVRTPATFTLEEVRQTPEKLEWPVFVKPVSGSASRGISIVHKPTELPARTNEPMIVQQMLKGPEYTVNIFVGKSGDLRSAVVHERLQVRAGEVEKGQTIRRADLQQLAHQVVAALPEPVGVLCFQIIDDTMHGPHVFEINARFGGGYPLVDHAGGKFAKWLLEEALDVPSSVNDNWRNGVKMLRYDAAIFQG